MNLPILGRKLPISEAISVIEKSMHAFSQTNERTNEQTRKKQQKPVLSQIASSFAGRFKAEHPLSKRLITACTVLFCSNTLDAIAIRSWQLLQPSWSRTDTGAFSVTGVAWLFGEKG